MGFRHYRGVKRCGFYKAASRQGPPWPSAEPRATLATPQVLALGLKRRCVTATVRLLLGLLVGPLALLKVT